MIVRARIKRLEDLPCWALCCPRSRETTAAQAGKEISVNTKEVSTTYFRCTCGAVTPLVKVMTVVNARVVNVGTGDVFNVIPIDCYDIDEGLQS